MTVDSVESGDSRESGVSCHSGKSGDYGESCDSGESGKFHDSGESCDSVELSDPDESGENGDSGESCDYGKCDVLTSKYVSIGINMSMFHVQQKFKFQLVLEIDKRSVLVVNLFLVRKVV